MKKLIIKFLILFLICSTVFSQDEDTERTSRNNNRCVSFCEECNSEGTECLTCFQSYGLKGSNTCEECHDINCKRCDHDQSRCAECLSGYFLKDTNPDGETVVTCSPCSNGCKSCVDEDICTSCRIFYKKSTREESDKEFVECSLKLWILGLFLLPSLICLGISFTYSDDWVENIIKKSKQE
jgi:hypothetical protein